MRDLLIFLIAFTAIPFTFAKPHIGLLAYSWFGYLNPHRLSWGHAYSFQFSMIIGVATIAAWFLSKEPKKIPLTPLSVLMVAFTLWFSFTTVFAIMPDAALEKWDRSIKILIISFITMALITNRDRLNALVWVITLSLGFYGLRGGIFTVITGGQYRVWGPPESFIADNNHLAAALIMTLPLMRYLQLQTSKRYLRWGLLAAMPLTGLAILGSQSRGAAIAGAAMLLVLWLRSRKKIMLGIALIAAVSFSLAFMPQSYFDRLKTIQSYEDDGSATGRLDTWEYAFRYALTSPIVGGGFNMFDSHETRQRFTPGQRTRASHSIWFEVLGEHGFVGLFLFLAIGATALFTCGRVRRRTRGDPERLWAFDLSSNLQVSLIGFAVAGTFLNKAFYDLYWHLLAVIVCMSFILRKEMAKPVELQLATSEEVDSTLHPSQGAVPAYSQQWREA